MPNLVGIGNSQVPTNAMLGGLAYQDSVGEINIDKIKARVSDTATDIFVYDTRKDSDGGAWRHRTQNTSWYNEGASETRGARKEFPAVAVIVAERNFITIYDGDDPNLSMWMVFKTLSPDGTSQGMGFPSQGTGRPMLQLQNIDKVVHMLNGILVTGTKNEGSNYGQPVINFINEKVLRMDSQGGEGGEWIGNIAQRNDSLGYRHVTHDYVIRASYVHDIAMTVLPNARIDETTGLPIPTIAVATNGGVSVIRDDGTVIDHYDSAGSPSTQITFTQDGKIAFSHEGHTGIRIDSLKSADFNYGSNKVAKHNSEEFYINYGLISSGWSGNAPKLNEGAFNSRGQIVPVRDNILAENSNKGLNLLARDFPSSPDNNRVAYITSNYNTGWMHGDIKGAFLSDTSTDNVTGTELITNGGPFSNTTGWTADNGFVISESGNRLRIDSNGNGASYYGAYYTFTTVVGKKYALFVNIHSSNANSVVSVTGSGTYFTTTNLAPGKEHSFYFTSDQASTTVRIGSNVGAGSNRVQEVNNVSVREVEEDRSVNSKGLQIHGTLQRDPVATGAELVAYHGVSANNFLRQPYNPDLNFGTGDFSIFVWAKKNTFSTNHYIIDRARTSPSWGGSSGRAYFIINSSGYHRFKLAGGSQQDGDQSTMPTGVFTQIGFVRRSGAMELYFNGQIVQTITGSNASANFDNGNLRQTLTVNRYADGFASDYTMDRMALLRISGSAPTEEQIKKMYNDEKCLFHENAKCTLHGTSDDVIALASDDTNDILHVGTSSGRSEFQGLNRINNTTKAVTTAISASNGLVAEQ